MVFCNKFTNFPYIDPEGVFFKINVDNALDIQELTI